MTLFFRHCLRAQAFLLPALLTLALFPAAAAPPPGQDALPSQDALPRHLRQAEILVHHLRGARENVYGGGRRHITWGADHCAARTVCSSFVTLLLQHSYGWSDDLIRDWLGSADPQAGDYHDAIAERRGFKRILHVTALKPGDFLAVKYTDHHVSRDGVEDTGHILLVCAPPLPVNDGKPRVPGTHQYAVTIIDSSASGHGPTDTRHQPGGSFTGGIGRGVMRLYADADGKIAGYAWSDTPKSDFIPHRAAT